MNPVQETIAQLVTEFQETKSKLTEKETQLTEKETQLIEKEKQLAEKEIALKEMTEKLSKLECKKAPSGSFGDQLQAYKSEMEKGIFNMSYNEFYVSLTDDQKKEVEKTLTSTIFHNANMYSNVCGYRNFYCYSNVIRLFDSEDDSMKSFKYSNPNIIIPVDMAKLIGVKNKDVANGQNVMIYVTFSQKCIHMTFLNATIKAAVTIAEGYAFGDIALLYKAFRLRQIADQHNSKVFETIQKRYTDFVECVKKSQSADNKPEP